MSIDLDWSQLDAELSQRCLDAINAGLSSSNRPAFLGTIVATSFSFGSVSPELELVEIRDVFEEFLQLDDDNDEDIFSRRDVPLFSPGSSLSGFPRIGLGTPAPFLSHLSAVHMQHQPTNGSRASVASGSTTPGFPFPRNAFPYAGDPFDRRSAASSSVFNGEDGTARNRDISPSGIGMTQDSSSDLSLQLHFRVKYSGDMCVAFKTSIQVNYPAPSFISLPLGLKLSAMAFEGIFVVAYEGDRKRLHVCALHKDRQQSARGQQLLRRVKVESEVGQAEKLVLKDIRKVEEFVVNAARKALEDEIAWPNFQSFAWT